MVARGELFWGGSLGHDEGEIERSVELKNGSDDLSEFCSGILFVGEKFR